MIAYTSDYGRMYTYKEIEDEIKLWIKHEYKEYELNYAEIMEIMNKVMEEMFRSIDGEIVYAWLQGTSYSEKQYLIENIKINRHRYNKQVV